MSSQTISQPIASILETQLSAVKTCLLDAVPPQAGLLKDALSFALQKPGKLFRPRLLLLILNALNAFEQYEKSGITTAAVAEMIHTATLLHDDVIDKADLRRNQPTIKAVFGNKTAILTGDYLLAQASVNLSTLNNCRLVAIYAQTLANLCEGELIQAEYQGNIETPWAQYEKKNYCKTASLFEACAESAGVIAQCSDAEIEALKSYGKNLGLAFQVADDLLDYTSTEEELGKPVLDDLANGIVTAPILFAFESANKEEVTQLAKTIIENPQDKSAKQALLSVLLKGGHIEQGQQQAVQYSKKAQESVQFLSDSPFKEALIELAQNAVHRKK